MEGMTHINPGLLKIHIVHIYVLIHLYVSQDVMINFKIHLKLKKIFRGSI